MPDRLSPRVTHGVRVRVRLAGQLVEGYVVGENHDYSGSLTPLDSVVSEVPVLAPAVLRLCHEVARHYAGSVSDVVRLAVPPRVAAPEAGWRPVPASDIAPPPSAGLAGLPIIASAAAGQAVRAVWSAPAGLGWANDVAAAATAVAAAGRGVLIVVPDGGDVSAVARACRALAGDAVAVLTSDEPPRQRYAQFLSVLSGRARVVVGTRAAAFAPIHDPGLLIVWDDGDTSLAEQRAPYPHAREVLAIRSHLESCALLIAGFARSPDSQRWIDAGWAQEVGDRELLRASRPQPFATADRVRSPFDLARRLPQSAVAALRAGLQGGPVLVQVSRTGYVTLTACRQCRELAECPHCSGPLSLSADAVVVCRRCDSRDPFLCPHCGDDRLRAVRTGARRTAEELGRMFPGVPVVQSTGEHPVGHVDDVPAVVVSTPGVEPVPANGYHAGALLDAQEDLWRVGLRSREEAVRRWFNAAALLRPAAPLAICGDSDDPAVQALIRWDPQVAARSELARRQVAQLPPARQVAQVDGAPADLEHLVSTLSGDVEVLGPRELSPTTSRVLLRAADFVAMRDEIHQFVLTRAAGHKGRAVRVQIDPVVLD